jgi:hypothetical protein
MIDTPAQETYPLKPGVSWEKEFGITYPEDTDLTGVVVRVQVRKSQTLNGAILAELDLGSDMPATANGSEVTLVLSATGASAVPNRAAVRLRLTRDDTAQLPYDTDVFAEIDLLYPNGEDCDTPVEITFNVSNEVRRG